MTHALAIEGAQRAAARASRVHANWSERAYDFLVRWAALHDGVFMTEDVRHAAEAADTYLPPPDARAWGAVILRAKREGKLVHAGYAPNKDSTCHGSPKSVWRWL